jgi:hypothetical protein
MEDRRMSRDAAPVPVTLMPQFLAWLAARPRGYAETMDAWRTSCPRLSAWEDALDQGLIRVAEGGAVVLTPAGRSLLDRHEPRSAAPHPVLSLPPLP